MNYNNNVLHHISKENFKSYYSSLCYCKCRSQNIDMVRLMHIAVQVDKGKQYAERQTQILELTCYGPMERAERQPTKFHKFVH